MRKSNAAQNPTRTHVSFVRRQLSTNEQKVTPIVNKESYDIKPNMPVIRNFSSFTSQIDPSHSEGMKNAWTINTDEAMKTHTITPASSELSSYESKPIHFAQPKQSSGSIRRWYSDLTPQKKTLVKAGIVAVILFVCAAAIILPLLFLVILRSSSPTTTTTTTTPSTVISALWTFDQTTADSYGIYNGTFVNGASYLSVSTSQPYIGNGRALTLLAALNQSYNVLTPFFNLAYTSFTVEAWIYSTNITGDRGIFSQCACSTCSNQCFYLIVRSGRLYADFNFNSVSGSTAIAINTWYHVAFVYNYVTNEQILYVKGVQDAIVSNAEPYQGTNASIQIGAAQISVGTYYFNGYIDNVRLTTRAKSSTEILFDASVTAYYSFDTSSGNNDNGPNGLNGLSINTAIVNGRVNQAMRFSGLYSYFQAYGFYQMIYSVSNQPFSLSLWINPSAVSSSTIVQMTQLQSNGSCFSFIGITSPNGLTGQIMVQGFSWPILYGSFLTMNTWTHISVTYSPANGMTLYVSGVRFGSTGTWTFGTQSFITWLQIGYNFPNTGGNLPNNAYQGLVDEVYVHSRELAQADITALANP